MYSVGVPFLTHDTPDRLLLFVRKCRAMSLVATVAFFAAFGSFCIAQSNLPRTRPGQSQSTPDAPAKASSTNQTNPAQQPVDPVLTMLPHTEGNRYWLSGQANIIFQGRIPFHSPYEGPNSFRSSAEYKASLIGTLYTAVRATRSIRYNTDLIFDMESAGGRGLSQALGLAGFTNLDVVRNPTLGSKPYIARYEIHQVIGLTNQTSSQSPNFFALAPEAPARRLEFRMGKMTLPDFFDINDIGSPPRRPSAALSYTPER
jgi:high affinity Mn2+ porin